MKATTFKKMKSIDLDSFQSDIQASSLCDDNQLDVADALDAYTAKYTITLSALLD